MTEGFLILKGTKIREENLTNNDFECLEREVFNETYWRQVRRFGEVRHVKYFRLVN